MSTYISQDIHKADKFFWITTNYIWISDVVDLSENQPSE